MPLVAGRLNFKQALSWTLAFFEICASRGTGLIQIPVLQGRRRLLAKPCLSPDAGGASLVLRRRRFQAKSQDLHTALIFLVLFVSRKKEHKYLTTSILLVFRQ